MVSFGVAFGDTAAAVSRRNSNAEPKMVWSIPSLPVTLIADGVNSMSPASLWNTLRRFCSAFCTPAISYMKSMCQEARLNSPSVTERSPMSPCILTASRIASSSTARRSSGEIAPRAASSRACSRARGRSRLPT